MPAALAVVSGSVIKPSVIMIKHKVFALVAHNLGNALKISCMLGKDKRAGIAG